MRTTRSSSILSLLFIFFACSKLDLVSFWVDTYITKRIDHYFGINSLQSQLVKNTLGKDIKKVKKITFPEFAEQMIKIKNEVDEISRFDVDKIASYQKALRKIFNKGLAVFEPSAQDFVNHLEPSQLLTFKEEFDERTNDLKTEADKTLTAKEKRYSQLKKEIENWLGPLFNIQKKDLEIFCNTNLFPLKEQILNRNKLLKDFVDSFPDVKRRKKFVHQLFYEYEFLREEHYAKAVEEDQKKLFALIAIILNKMSPEQRSHLSKTLKERAEQFRKSVND